jgi:polyphenol oxidase
MTNDVSHDPTGALPNREAAGNFLRSSLLDGFRHAFSTSKAGDFSLSRPERAIAEARLASELALPLSRIHQATQVHDACILDVGEEVPLETAHADALYAPKGSNCAIAVRVADCVPILLANVATGSVAAVHAGWRGIELRIVRVAVTRMMRDVGSAAPVGGPRVGLSALRAAVGPCIGVCCFEVRGDVAERIVLASERSALRTRHPEPSRLRGPGERCWVDLRRAVRVQLLAEGLTHAQIEDVGGCTRCEPLNYWSYRRDGDASGRLIAAIVPA